MSVKIPEQVILKAQKDVYDLYSEYMTARREMEEVAKQHQNSIRKAVYAGQNIRELCEFLDQVSPFDKDWSYLEEVSGGNFDDSDLKVDEND